jgi:hypothetical protein
VSRRVRAADKKPPLPKLTSGLPRRRMLDPPKSRRIHLELRGFKFCELSFATVSRRRRRA